MKRDVEAKSHFRRDTGNMMMKLTTDLADQNTVEEIDERFREIPEMYIPTPSHAG